MVERPGNYIHSSLICLSLPPLLFRVFISLCLSLYSIKRFSSIRPLICLFSTIFSFYSFSPIFTLSYLLVMIINISLLPVFLLFNIFPLKFSYILCIVNVQCRLYSIRAGYKWRNEMINFHFRFHSYYTVFIRILCTHFHSYVEAKVSNCHFISFPMRFMFSSSARFKFIISICLIFNFFSAASLFLLFTLLFSIY